MSSRQLNRASTVATIATESDIQRAERFPQINLASRAASLIFGAALTQALLLASIQSEGWDESLRKDLYKEKIGRYLEGETNRSKKRTWNGKETSFEEKTPPFVLVDP